MKKILSLIKKVHKHLAFLEETRIKAMIKSGKGWS